MKTNAMRLLDQKKIEYSYIEYKWDEKHFNATSIAQTLNVDENIFYKTIVMRDEKNNLFVFVLPSNKNINKKKAKEETMSKELELIKINELLALTGYIRGGCSPLAMIKKYPTLIEKSEDEYIYVSGGKRGLALYLKKEDLAKATEARFTSFT